MRTRSDKRWSGMILGMVSMVLILMVTVAVSPPVGSRVVRTLGRVVERLREAPGPRTSAEIRERWRVTRPGMLFSKDFISKSEPPALRAEEKQGKDRANGQVASSSKGERQ
jgi:hypothetical protein